MVSSVTYETARPDDYPAVCQMIESQDYFLPTLNRTGMDLDQFRKSVRTVGSVSVIRLDGEMAGFYWTELRERTLHLHGLILTPACQGQGIGSGVLAMLAETWAGTADRIELGVHRSNVRAIALYEREGFRTVRVLDSLDFLVMHKPLTA